MRIAVGGKHRNGRADVLETTSVAFERDRLRVYRRRRTLSGSHAIVLVSRFAPLWNFRVDPDMFDTILIAVDLSATNDVVLDRASSLATSDHTEIILLHVIETLDGVSVEEDPEFYEELHDNATEKMTPWAEKLKAAGFEVTARVDYGKQGQEIVAAAQDTGADLIVMRSHVVDTEADASDQVGTVSHQVALFAPCSVLLVRKGGEREG